MNNLKNYVNWKLTHADKTAEAEGYPLVLENCKANKRMKQLEIYGNSFQDGTPTPDAPIEVQSVGELVTDANDANYGKYKIPLVQRGVNLFSMTKAGFTAKTVNGITFTPLDDERIHIKGKIADASSNAVYNPAFKVKVPIGKGIYNVKPYSGISTIMFRADKDKNNNFLININATSTNVNVAEDAYLTRIHIQINATSTKEWDDIVPIQITKGTNTKNLAYEPYAEPTSTNIFLNEPLRKIGDYADYVDFKDKKVIRATTHEKITQVAGKSSQGLLFLSYISQKPLLTGVTGNPVGYGISNKFQQHKKTYSMLQTATEPLIQTYISTNGGFRAAYVFGDSSITDAAQAQEAIGDGFEMYYVLATPIEETITCELPKLNAKTTIIEVDTSLAPSYAYSKYIKR